MTSPRSVGLYCKLGALPGAPGVDWPTMGGQTSFGMSAGCAGVRPELCRWRLPRRSARREGREAVDPDHAVELAEVVAGGE